jgi:hypothetical protein
MSTSALAACKICRCIGSSSNQERNPKIASNNNYVQSCSTDMDLCILGSTLTAASSRSSRWLSSPLRRAPNRNHESIIGRSIDYEPNQRESTLVRGQTKLERERAPWSEDVRCGATTMVAVMRMQKEKGRRHWI